VQGYEVIEADMYIELGIKGQIINSSNIVCGESKKLGVNADSPGSYLINCLMNYLAVLWLGGRSCSAFCCLQTWCIGIACRGSRENSL
jgi:hypothetical protein